MKKLIVLFVLTFIISESIAQDCQIGVRVTGIESVKGDMIYAVFDNEEDYLEKPVKSLTIPVNDKNNEACIDGLKPGVYSISVIHDLDKNGKLNTRLYGPPSEPYGFYNNLKGFMGPPAFKDTSFQLENGEKKNIEIKLFD